MVANPDSTEVDGVVVELWGRSGHEFLRSPESGLYCRTRSLLVVDLLDCPAVENQRDVETGHRLVTDPVENFPLVGLNPEASRVAADEWIRIEGLDPLIRQMDYPESGLLDRSNLAAGSPQRRSLRSGRSSAGSVRRTPGTPGHSPFGPAGLPCRVRDWRATPAAVFRFDLVRLGRSPQTLSSPDDRMFASRQSVHASLRNCEMREPPTCRGEPNGKTTPGLHPTRPRGCPSRHAPRRGRLWRLYALIMEVAFPAGSGLTQRFTGFVPCKRAVGL